MYIIYIYIYTCLSICIHMSICLFNPIYMSSLGSFSEEFYPTFILATCNGGIQSGKLDQYPDIHIHNAIYIFILYTYMIYIHSTYIHYVCPDIG